MGFLSKLSQITKRREIEISNDRDRQLEKAHTKQAKEAIKLQHKKAMMLLKKEEAEAKTALLNAEIAKKRARKELNDIEDSRLYKIERTLRAGIQTKKAALEFVGLKNISKSRSHPKKKRKSIYSQRGLATSR